MSSSNFNKPSNRLLAALPEEDYLRLYPHLEPVKLPQHKIIYSAGDEYKYAYFPSNSIISSVAIMENGATTEIGMIGNEGMLGIPIILGASPTNHTAIVLVGDGAYRIAAQYLRKELERQGALQHLLMRYVQARMVQLGQLAACNRYHTVEQRFSRWLLTVIDTVKKDEYQLTHEFISQMLGVRRTGITEVAGKFQKAGIINYKRGSINVCSRKKLEACTCECYKLISQEFSRLLD